jgi:hypothetical protein
VVPKPVPQSGPETVKSPVPQSGPTGSGHKVVPLSISREGAQPSALERGGLTPGVAEGCPPTDDLDIPEFLRRVS